MLFNHNWKQRPKWVIFILTCIGLIADVYGYKMAVSYQPNAWLINLFTFTEFTFLSYFFFLIIKERRIRFLTKIFYLCFIIFWIIRNFFILNIFQFDYISQNSEFIFIFSYCLIYFYERIRNIDSIQLYKNYQFWIVSALFIYCAVTFFSFMVVISNSSNADVRAFEFLIRVGNIIKSILITIAFCIHADSELKNRRNPNSIYYIKDIKGKE